MQNVLNEQDIERALDVYDAIIAENDLELLIERLKKSLGATLTAIKFLNKRREATNN